MSPLSNQYERYPHRQLAIGSLRCHQLILGGERVEETHSDLIVSRILAYLQQLIIVWRSLLSRLSGGGGTRLVITHLRFDALNGRRS